jgi:hypothetical protein
MPAWAGILLENKQNTSDVPRNIPANNFWSGKPKYVSLIRIDPVGFTTKQFAAHHPSFC